MLLFLFGRVGLVLSLSNLNNVETIVSDSFILDFCLINFDHLIFCQSWLSFSYMVCHALISKWKHQCEPKLHSVWSYVVSFTSNDEWTCADIKASGWSFRYLFSIDPIYWRQNFLFPCFRPAYLELCCLIKSNRRHYLTWRVLNDSSSCSCQISVHKQVSLIHVLLHQSFILLSVLAWQN